MVSGSLGVNLVIIATKINPTTEPTKNETMAENLQQALSGLEAANIRLEKEVETRTVSACGTQGTYR